ncbi:hypothetical protein SAMN05216326_12728 [Nitrosomonas marina]|uniref:Inorganic pyrophosphatase domain-containing protein n=1 Tax=Nitrosomonas marina TaxID=917 RepID=A0A1I0EIP7_9PROT|nr:hypothetical protein [Nitrosomonas marina]SET44332.1 hypothetical protein SAMN05216326_12728 [Nitrosomonas marina]
MPISHAELEEASKRYKPYKPHFDYLEEMANSGAFGNNSTPTPTDAQCKAGNYKKGRFSLHGIPIAIEQPRNTYRTGIDEKTGKRWTSRLAAHYGYLSGTKGADGDGVDCFVGVFPDAEYVYAVNQHINGRFDEHKILIAFYDQESAVNAYMGSYERGWNGLGSIVRMTVPQLKWWLKNGDKSRPINKTDLPHEGLEAMTQRVYWNNDAMPLNGRTLDHVLYEIRRSDSSEKLIMDPVTIQEIIEDSEGVLAFDALVTPYAKLERKMEILQGIMERTGKDLKPVSMQISEPFKRNNVANVAVVYELSDGQTITIYLHNPDVTPKKMAATDEVISWKWMLNKKDITIVVAPERGQDLNVREVARRIMKLAEKNSAGFARANARRAECMQNIQSLKDEIASLEAELKKAENERDALKIEVEDRDRSLEDMHIAVREALSKRGWNGFEDGSAMTMGNYRVSGSSSDLFTVEFLDEDSGVWGDFGRVKTDLGKTAEQIAEEIERVVFGKGNTLQKQYEADLNSAQEKWRGIGRAHRYLLLLEADAIPGGIDDDSFLDYQPKILTNMVELFKNDWTPDWNSAVKYFRKNDTMANRGELLFESINNAGGYKGYKITEVEHKYINGWKAVNDAGHEINHATRLDKLLDLIDESGNSGAGSLNPTSPEGYATIMADESLQIQYQDVLDSFFQERIVAVRNALRYVDWDGENGATSLSKTLGGVVYQASFSYKQVGAGANIVGFTVSVNSNSREGGIAQIATIVDDLSRTPEQIAGEIDDAVSVDDGNSGNESEEITAAKAFLQSVIDGAKDAANLMDLLDEIDASAKALIDAGMGSEYDELIGKAAEKWAELDQQANG